MRLEKPLRIKEKSDGSGQRARRHKPEHERISWTCSNQQGLVLAAALGSGQSPAVTLTMQLIIARNATYYASVITGQDMSR